MVKTQEELNALKEEVEAVCKKLRGLSEEELAEGAGGTWVRPDGGIPIVHA